MKIIIKSRSKTDVLEVLTSADVFAYLQDNDIKMFRLGDILRNGIESYSREYDFSKLSPVIETTKAAYELLGKPKDFGSKGWVAGFENPGGSVTMYDTHTLGHFEIDFEIHSF